MLELTAYRETTTRLHPRPGRPDVAASSVGGPLLWPSREKGPVLRTTSELVMFDAAYFGTEVGTLADSTVLDLGTGRHRVDSASIEPDHLTCFRVHRFVELT